MGKVNIEGLRKDKVLKALYYASHNQGLGFLQAVPNFSLEDAKEEIETLKRNDRELYFDYLHGRVLKVDITNDEFDDYLFDRNCGEGSAKKAIDDLKSQYKELCGMNGYTLEEVIKALKECHKLRFVDFNGHCIYSDNIEDVDEIYKKVIGKTEEEFKNDKKEFREEYKKHKEELNYKIEELAKEYIEKAKGVIVDEKLDYWAKIVPIRLGDLYEGMELQATLDIIISLGENKDDFESAKKVLDSQGHSGHSYALIISMLSEFSPNGEKLVEWLKNN